MNTLMTLRQIAAAGWCPEDLLVRRCKRGLSHVIHVRGTSATPTIQVHDDKSPLLSGPWSQMIQNVITSAGGGVPRAHQRPRIPHYTQSLDYIHPGLRIEKLQHK